MANTSNVFTKTILLRAYHFYVFEQGLVQYSGLSKVYAIRLFDRKTRPKRFKSLLC